MVWHMFIAPMKDRNKGFSFSTIVQNIVFFYTAIYHLHHRWVSCRSIVMEEMAYEKYDSLSKFGFVWFIIF